MFLSACETDNKAAVGPLTATLRSGSDTTTDLLHRAGVSCVISSPCEAWDEPSSRVIEQFYAALFEDGMDDASALKAGLAAVNPKDAAAPLSKPVIISRFRGRY